MHTPDMISEPVVMPPPLQAILGVPKLHGMKPKLQDFKFAVSRYPSDLPDFIFRYWKLQAQKNWKKILKKILVTIQK